VSSANKIVRAVRGGYCIKSQTYGKWGSYIVIRQHDGLYAIYAHLSKRYIRMGQNVEQGASVGVMGATGNAKGAHLHFELQETYYDAKSTVNAADYLSIENKVGKIKYL